MNKQAVVTLLLALECVAEPMSFDFQDLWPIPFANEGFSTPKFQVNSMPAMSGRGPQPVPSPRIRHSGPRATPPLQTAINNTRSQTRYSYMETPLEMQQPVFHQFSSPTNSTIDESPLSAASPSRALPVYDDQDMRGTPLPEEKALGAELQAPPVQTHPAFAAPYTEDAGRAQQGAQSAAFNAAPDPPPTPGPIPSKRYNDEAANTTPKTQSTASPDPKLGIDRRETYNPHSLQGPNVGLLAAIHRARVRKLYKIDGTLGTDCVKSLCCCCCVVAQNEREVKDREELISRHAGPVSGAYVAPTGGMSYAPPLG
ncbi:MAG: hypothetical protein Q9217_003100 [Psora testacea]